MAVAKPNNLGWAKKKIKKVVKEGKKLLPRIFPPATKMPGQMDYPAISKVLEAEKKRKKLLNEMGK